jgi:hypothetical protein
MGDITINISDNTANEGPLGLLDCPNEVIEMIAKAVIPGTSRSWTYDLGLELSNLCNFVRANRRLYTQFSHLLYQHNVTMVNACGDEIATDLAAEWGLRQEEWPRSDRLHLTCTISSSHLRRGIRISSS